MAFFRDAHDLLDLRFGLQHEIFRRPSAQNENRGFPPARFRLIDNGRRLIDIAMTSSINLESRMAMAATFIPMELSPGLLVNTGMPHS